MIKLFILIIFYLSTGFASDISEYQWRENRYKEYIESIKNKDISKSLFLTNKEEEIFVDALWDLVEEQQSSAVKLLPMLNKSFLNLEENFRIELIDLKTNGTKISQAIIDQVRVELNSLNASLKLIYLIASYEEDLTKQNLSELIDLAKKDARFLNVKKEGLLSSEEMKDLFNFDPQNNGLRVYLICRQNRLYSCLMVMKDKNHNWVLNSDHEIWTHQGLALSARGLPSHQRNGSTPSGVWKINSVMPEANEQMSFGKNRRLIIEFIEPSENETLLKELIPESSHNHSWWIPSVVARDIGRNDFRIHGTGKLNPDPKSTYFPFMRTAGCIAQRENTYNKVTYKDQRVLLDKMMSSLDLEIKYENEKNIYGLLYLVEIDNEYKPVTIEDLKIKGIL